ncbi:putative pentatricopeptide repeat protein [Lasiodiplodia theobromae]|nr:putative pentatricopeptide repeat protein [Lasiodiplodia theobromae]
MDNFFINALVQAGSCRKHREWQGMTANAALLHNSCRPRRKRVDDEEAKGSNVARRQFSRAAKPRGQQAASRNNGRKTQKPKESEGEEQPSLDQLKRLVDFYGPNVHLETWKEQEEREAREAEEETETRGPTLSEWDGGEDGGNKEGRIPFHERHKPWPNKDEVESESIGELEELLEERDLAPELAYEIYSGLSWPRAAYLSYNTIRNLLHCLGVVRKRSEASMMRYLAVIDDMKAAEIPIALADWNMAIQFAGRCFRKISNSEVESALWLWREMEHQAGTRGNHVTFNILFDIAVKAGKYKLAEMVKNEMTARGLKMDRYFRTSTIMWRGLSRDGEGVRRAYKDLVDAGEIVDTAVLNCVITALLKAGEPAAAEQVFLRMKSMQGMRETTKIAPRNWRQRRELGQLLNKAAERTRGNAEAHKEIQEHSPVGPDYGTFKTLIRYHGMESGNINRITDLLDEMDRIYNIPLEGDMFYSLFWGFQKHGGERYSPWTKERLEGTWLAFAMALDKKNEDICLDRSIAKVIILAFAKCTDKVRTLEVWEEMRKRWNPSEEDLEVILSLLGTARYAQAESTLT